MSEIITDKLWTEKYRPQSLDELVLEPDIRVLLTKFLREEMIPHLLLCGSVGTGKTTVAKILIKVLDCDSIVLNASDERGIETVRNKIKQFAMMSSFKKWRVVFLDESDALTSDAQFSLRNIMETYSNQTRFILTANYGNKVIEPIRSRCQIIEFNSLYRKDIRVLLERVLKSEDVKYDIEDLLTLIDLYYPDIRSMINCIQLYTVDGVWKLRGVERFRNFEQLIMFLKKGDLKNIRKLNLDYVECYKYLFDKVDELTEDYSKRIELSLLIAEYFYRETFIADKSINFAACCLSILEKMNVQSV